MWMHCYITNWLLHHYLIVTTLLVLNLEVIFPNNFCFLALFCGVRCLNSGFARQMLYLLSNTSSIYCSGYFGSRSCLCPDKPDSWSSYFRLPAIARMTGVHYHAQVFSIEIERLTSKLLCSGWPRTAILLTQPPE
jgi:hypothetical protein